MAQQTQGPPAPFGRIVTAMVTPFDDDGELDLAAARGLARHLADHGSEGLVVSGTTGECPTLSDRERRELLDAILDEVGDRCHVVAGTGTYSTAHSVELTRAAVTAGAEAVLVVTPYYNKPPAEGILRHFEAVGEAAGGRPVIAYNIPQRVVVNISSELFERMLERVQGLVAVKQALTDRQAARDIVELGLALYAGNDDLLAPFLELGGCGGICVASHIAGRELLELCERHAAGDVEGMRTLDAELRPLLDALSVTTNPIPVKAALTLLGHPVGGLRLPLVEATGGERDVIAAALERRGLLVRA